MADQSKPSLFPLVGQRYPLTPTHPLRYQYDLRSSDFGSLLGVNLPLYLLHKVGNFAPKDTFRDFRSLQIVSTA